jgi:hypothetical protein
VFCTPLVTGCQTVGGASCQTGVGPGNLPRAGSLLEPSHVVGRALLVPGGESEVQDRLDRVAVPPALDFSMAIGEREATGAVGSGGDSNAPIRTLCSSDACQPGGGGPFSGSVNIVQLTPGAGSMYYGNCLRDNALGAILRPRFQGAGSRQWPDHRSHRISRNLPAARRRLLPHQRAVEPRDMASDTRLQSATTLTNGSD